MKMRHLERYVPMNSIEKSRYVQLQITKTLLELLKEKNIEDIDIRYLCSKAGVGRASFYRNYSSKEDVILQYSNKLIQEWGTAFENDPNSSPFNVFGSLFKHYKEHSSFYSTLIRQNMSYIILDTIKKTVGLLPELSNKEAYEKAFFAYGLYGWICEWIQRGMQESPEEINQMLSHNQPQQ